MLPVRGFVRVGATRFFGVDQNALGKGVPTKNTFYDLDGSRFVDLDGTIFTEI